jgi:hypothetical protein
MQRVNRNEPPSCGCIVFVLIIILGCAGYLTIVRIKSQSTPSQPSITEIYGQGLSADLRQQVGQLQPLECGDEQCWVYGDPLGLEMVLFHTASLDTPVSRIDYFLSAELRDISLQAPVSFPMYRIVDMIIAVNLAKGSKPEIAHQFQDILGWIESGYNDRQQIERVEVELINSETGLLVTIYP